MQQEAVKQQTIRLGDIVIDPTYQIRMKVDSSKVTEYKIVLELNQYNPFPPITVELGTNKLVCGFTRYEAYKKLYTPDYEVDVITMGFKTDLERISYATEDNMTHGQPLGSWDKKNIVDRMLKIGASVKAISDLIKWKIDRIEKLAGVVVVTRTAKTKQEPTSSDSEETEVEEEKSESEAQEETPKGTFPYVIVDGEKRMLKQGLSHLNGETVSSTVYSNIVEHYVGWTEVFLAKQLIMRIDDGTLNLAEKEVKNVLKDMCKKLRTVGIK